MSRVIYIEHNGTEHEISAENGRSLMQIATDHAVPGILADCGGCCSCATCHCYVDAQWRDKVPAPSADELAMLEGALEVKEGSRLSCQILMTDALDGIVVRLPSAQT